MKKYVFSFILVFLFGFLILLWGSMQQEDEYEDIRRVIKTERAPAAIGPYSQAVQVERRLYLAGQIGIDPKTGELVSDSLHLQVWQAMDNLEAVLEAAEFTMNDVVEVQVYLTDMDQFARFNELYDRYFTGNFPARAVVEAARLPLDAKVEIKMTAVKRNR